MSLQICDGAAGVKTPDGRTVSEIINDIKNPTPQEQELLDIIEMLTNRLVYADSERF